MRRAFHLQSMSLFRDAAEYIRWLRAIRAPVLVAAGDKDVLTPLVCYFCEAIRLIVCGCLTWRRELLHRHSAVLWHVLQEGMGKITAGYITDARTCLVPLAGHQVRGARSAGKSIFHAVSILWHLSALCLRRFMRSSRWS